MEKAKTKSNLQGEWSPLSYELELFEEKRSMELPFVIGVLIDLSGNGGNDLPSVSGRKFQEIDLDNFDDRLKHCQPRVSFAVPNCVTGEGALMIEMKFESLCDFEAEGVVRKVEPLGQLATIRSNRK